MTSCRRKLTTLRHVVIFGLLSLLWTSLCKETIGQDSRFEDPKIEAVPTLGSNSFDAKDDQAEGLESIEGEAIPGSTGQPSPDLGTYGPVNGFQSKQTNSNRSSLPIRGEEVTSQSTPLPNQYQGELIQPDWLGNPSESESLSSRGANSVLQSQPQRTIPPRLESPRLRIDGMKAVERANSKFDSSSHEIIRERYPDGSIKIVRTITQDAEGNYYNDGGWLMYDRQQRPIASGTFVRGAMEGDWERVHEPGTVGLFAQVPFNLFNGPYLSRANFVRNEIDGVWSISDKDGKLICSITYENGVRKGIASWYYPSGKKMREATFKDGVPNGFVLQWDQQGKLQRREQFVDGRRIIRKKTTYSNQQLASESVYRDRKLTAQGVDNWWAAKPATFAQDGEQVQYGPVAQWYPNRQPKMTGRFVDGERDGLFTWWHETHNKKAEGNFSRGKRVGLWRYWHESGMKRSEGRFEDDKPVGIWKSWNPAGRIVDERDLSAEPQAVELPDAEDSSPDTDADDAPSETDSGSNSMGADYSSEEPIYDPEPDGEEKTDPNPSRDPGSLGNLFGG